eukprot:6488718-Karenia_brevis.AAC.1
MGWVNAMGLAQYLHRRMHEMGMKLGRQLPAGREVRKDKAMPRLCEKSASNGGDCSSFWQVYCDDLDICELEADSE